MFIYLLDTGGLFLWAQSMFVLAQLLTGGLLHVNELDPIRRYLPSYNRPRRAGRYSAFQVCCLPSLLPSKRKSVSHFLYKNFNVSIFLNYSSILISNLSPKPRSYLLIPTEYCKKNASHSDFSDTWSIFLYLIFLYYHN